MHKYKRLVKKAELLQEKRDTELVCTLACTFLAMFGFFITAVIFF